MKKISALLLAAVLVCSLAACGGSSSSSSDQGQASGGSDDGTFEGDNITLKLSHNNSTSTTVYAGLEDWIEAVSEATHGTVTIVQYPSEQLGATSDGLNMLDTNVCDILWATTGMFSNQFNYSDSFSLPFLGVTSSEAGTNAYWDVYESDLGKYIDDEFAGFKVLMSVSSEGGTIGSNYEIKQASDIKGKVVRSVAGSVSDFVSAAEASPTFMGPSDIYLNMQKGVIDAYIFEFQGISAFTLGEETPYFLDADVYRVPHMCFMSEAAWNKLSTDQQEAIMSVSGREGSLKFSELFDNEEGEYIEKIKGEGTILTTPSEEELATWTDVAEKVKTAWAEKLDDGEAYIAAVEEAVAKYAE